jgi:hypothetical protein
MAAGSQIAGGWIAGEIAEEFPGLGLRWTIVPGPPRSSPRIIKYQLEELSDSIDAPRAIALRGRATVAAYRVFQRQLGLDPDVDRAPLERAIVDRMQRGAFLSNGLPADACTIAAVETGVPIWAIDADRLVGALGIRAVLPGEPVGRGRHVPSIRDERLVVADSEGALSLLFGTPGAGLVPRAGTAAIAFFALQAPGALEPTIDEALWLAAALASE